MSGEIYMEIGNYLRACYKISREQNKDDPKKSRYFEACLISFSSQLTRIEYGCDIVETVMAIYTPEQFLEYLWILRQNEGITKKMSDMLDKCADFARPLLTQEAPEPWFPEEF